MKKKNSDPNGPLFIDVISNLVHLVRLYSNLRYFNKRTVLNSWQELYTLYMDLHSFLKVFRTVRFKKDELIFIQDEAPSVAYAVHTGIVKVYNIDAAGEEKAIAFKLRDDIFSLGWLFEKQRRLLYFYQAYTDCVLYVLDRENFQREMTHNIRLAQWLVDHLVREQLADGLRFNALEQSRSSGKIAHILQILCLRYGEDITKDLVRINVPLRQQDLANFIGLTRETIALEIARLKKGGVIACKNYYYTVHTDKLNKLLPDEYNPGIIL